MRNLQENRLRGSRSGYKFLQSLTSSWNPSPERLEWLGTRCFSWITGGCYLSSWPLQPIQFDCECIPQKETVRKAPRLFKGVLWSRSRGLHRVFPVQWNHPSQQIQCNCHLISSASVRRNDSFISSMFESNPICHRRKKSVRRLQFGHPAWRNTRIPKSSDWQINWSVRKSRFISRIDINLFGRS